MKFKIAVLSVILGFFYNLTLFCQNTFDIRIATNNDEAFYGMIENHNNNYVFVGERRDKFDYSYQHAYITEIDPLGNIIRESIINKLDTFVFLTTLIQKDNDNYLAFGMIKAIEDTIKYFYICELDLNFDISKERIYSIPPGKTIFSLYSLENKLKNVILYGSFYTSYPFTLSYFLFETAQNGDSIKMVVQPDSKSNFSPIYSMIEKPGSGYFAMSHAFQNVNNYIRQIMSFDKDLNLISNRFLTEYVYNSGSLKWYSPDTYILSGKTHVLKGKSQDDQIVCMIIDTLHENLKYYKELGKPDTTDIPGLHSSMDFTERNTIFIAGIDNFDYGDSPYLPVNDNFIFLTVTDSMLNIKKEYFYGGDAGYILWDMKATSDNGCILTATRYDENTQIDERDIVILKVDSLGNLSTEMDEPPIKVHMLILYPNPGSDRLTVQTAIQCLGGTFTIFDSNGKEVLNIVIREQLTNLLTESLPSGQYVYRYILKDKVIETGKWIKILNP